MQGFLLAFTEERVDALLAEYPELRSEDALRTAEAELDMGPPEGLSDIYLRSRVEFVRGLVEGRPFSELRASYVASLMRHYNEEIEPELDRLLEAVDETSAGPQRLGQESIEICRRALSFAQRGDEELERQLSLELAVRLLQTTGAGEARRTEESILLLTRVRDLSGGQRDDTWIAATGNAGLAYGRRLMGERAANLEIQCELLQEAVSHSDRNADEKTWAINQTNFGYALATREYGDPSDNLNRALEHCLKGLEARSLEKDPLDWSFSKLNLGVIYERRGHDADLDRAEDSYRDILRWEGSRHHPQLYAASQHNLAHVLLEKRTVRSLAEAETRLREVMAALDENAYAVEYGKLSWLLAEVLIARDARPTTESIACAEQAWRLFDPLIAPRNCQQVSGHLADIYQERGEWASAVRVYRSSLKAADVLFDVQTSPDGRRRVLQETARLHRWAAYALCKVGQLVEAVEVLEVGRARELGVEVTRGTAELDELRRVDANLADRYLRAWAHRQDIIARVGPLSGGLLLESSRIQPDESLRDAEIDVNHIVHEIRRIPGFTRYMSDLTLADITRGSGDRPIAYLFGAPYGSAVLLVDESDDTREPITEAILIDSPTSGDVGTRVAALLLAQHDDARAFEQCLTEAVRELRPLATPFARWLAGRRYDEILVVPCGPIGLLPLHAVPIDDDGTVLDEVSQLLLSPSVAVFQACRRRVESMTRGNGTLLGIADPEPGNRSLPGARAELEVVAASFAPELSLAAVGSGATRQFLLENLADKTHIHLACHGRMDLDDPSAACLYLANDEVITSGELLSGVELSARLVVASACQTGQYDAAYSPDEFLGLAAGFIRAGAAAVVASLWLVNDRATALLMSRFYEELKPTTPVHLQQPARALRRARLWLRNLTNDEMANYVNNRPSLATALRQLSSVGRDRHGDEFPQSTDRPFDLIRFWAAFVMYGL